MPPNAAQQTRLIEFRNLLISVSLQVEVPHASKVEMIEKRESIILRSDLSGLATMKADDALLVDESVSHGLIGPLTFWFISFSQ